MSYRLGNDIATKTLEEVNKDIDNNFYEYNSPTDFAKKQLALACKNYLEAENNNHKEAYLVLIGTYKQKLKTINKRKKKSKIDKKAFIEDVKNKIKNEALALKYGVDVRTIQRWKKRHL